MPHLVDKKIFCSQDPSLTAYAVHHLYASISGTVRRLCRNLRNASRSSGKRVTLKRCAWAPCMGPDELIRLLLGKYVQLFLLYEI